jgi:seryl-tRNA synthetase
MLDPKLILAQPDLFKEIARKKRVNFDVDAFIALDEKRRALQTEGDALKAEKNEASKRIAQLQGDERTAAIAAMQNQGDTEKKVDEQLKEVEAAWTELFLRAPGLISDEVPEGKDDTENVELYTHGELPKFDFEAKDHVTLGKDLDILDIERGVKIAGSRSYFLKGDGALLELAILQYTLHKLVAKGFTAFLPPLLVNREAMTGTGYFPGGEEQAYTLTQDEKYLIGTSEVPVASYHSDETLDESELPKLYAGYSYCFRREAGTYGKDTHGLYRIHQFQKVEQVVICKADMAESQKLHEFLLKNAEEVLQDLKLPYRVVAVCSGDMGQGQYYKNDIETWMPSRNSYGETHSCSSFLDFQARRLNLKYKDKDGKRHFAYTLNNTCIASPRILIPVLECYQNADGSITVPEVLRPWMGGREKIGA